MFKTTSSTKVIGPENQGTKEEVTRIKDGIELMYKGNSIGSYKTENRH